MFQIGEFSKLARVSKRLLHHYEDIGLFKPAHVDQFSGYRYYSANQIPLLNKILALRDLGFTLEQIADMLQNNIPEQEIRGMLRMKQAETEKTIQQEQLRLKGIEARLQMLDMTDADLDVVIKEIPEMPRVALPKTRFLRILEVLITNAVEAMSANEEDRKLVLRCYKTRGRVWLEVEDNGCGIHPNDQHMIFNQGFSTKKKSSSFGLHYCANVIKEMGGHIKCKSPGPGLGARFILELPEQKHSVVQAS